MQDYSKESNGGPGRVLIFQPHFLIKKTSFLYKKRVYDQNRNLKAKFQVPRTQLFLLYQDFSPVVRQYYCILLHFFEI